MDTDDQFLASRRCMREPVPEIFHAAHLLDRAVGAHLAADRATAAALIAEANMPTVRAWTESLWGSKSNNPDQSQFHRYRPIAAVSSVLPKEDRIPQREPTPAEKRDLIERYGRNCVFCGIPLIRKEIREAIRRVYPDALPWGSKNEEQHAAFQCMWMQYDHVLPHSHGGDNGVSNVVLTCAPCNYGRMSWTLEEVGLIDPRALPVYKTSWDGLERFPH
jgi:5-methylcytosine-specific restriction endonuclease McrA